MLFAVLLAFAAALLAPPVVRWAGTRAGLVLGLVPAGLFVYFMARAHEVRGGRLVAETLAWVPSLGVDLTFALDGLSLMFALLVVGLGMPILLYAGGYLHEDPRGGRFMAMLLAFTGAMLGLVLSANLIVLFVFWELTGITSYLLVGHKHDKEATRAAALQALLVTGAGGLVLLVGLLLLGKAGGTFDLTALLSRGDEVRAHPLYPAALVCIALGCFAKSAQVPFHFWLPNAMAAPTPASAFLHSATMVKAGVYLLARLDPVLGGTPLWTAVLAPVGAATMIAGAVLAILQTDLKRILAYSTVTALGTLVLLLALSFEESIQAAVVFILVHALYKASLFLVAGIVEHETGTRDVRRLGGLRLTLPLTAKAALLGGLSMAGLPPLVGFIGKEMVYEVKLGLDAAGIVLTVAAVAANALTAVAAAVVVLRPFFGPVRTPPQPGGRVPWPMWTAVLVPALVSLGLGLFPNAIEAGIVEPAVRAILLEYTSVHLALWHGLGPALWLSVFTIVAAAVIYAGLRHVQRGLAWFERLARLPEAAYEVLMDSLVTVSRATTRVVQHGSLRGYIATLLGLAGVLIVAALVRGGMTWPHTSTALDPTGVALAAAVAVASAAAALTRSALAAAVSLGAAGFALALLFLALGAPDLAMTQLLVETLAVVVLVLALRRLPALRQSGPDSRVRRVRDAAFALGVGGAVTAVLMAVLALPERRGVADAIATLSVPQGFGRNVVNVILVDVRAMDTLGEIVVLGVAALGAAALLRRIRRPPAPAPSRPTDAGP